MRDLAAMKLLLSSCATPLRVETGISTVGGVGPNDFERSVGDGWNGFALGLSSDHRALDTRFPYATRPDDMTGLLT
jgi:hypothetical protein